MAFDPKIITKENPQKQKLPAKTQISRQNRLEFIVKCVHLIVADNHVGFYELFSFIRLGVKI